MENFFLPDNVKHRVFDIQKIKIFVLTLCVIGFLFFLNAPANFIPGTKVRIDQKSSLRNVSFELKKEIIIADVFSEKLTEFDKNKFLINTEGKEGYLFPDTYFFSNIDNEQDVVKAMSVNFEKKMAPLRKIIENLNKNERDIIIMASLIEAEAKGDTDREFISGILWKRLSINIPLQADV